MLEGGRVDKSRGRLAKSLYTLKENSPAKGGKEGKKEDIGGNGAKRAKVREGRKRFMAARINFFFEEEWTGRIYRPVFWEEQRDHPFPLSSPLLSVRYSLGKSWEGIERGGEAFKV